MILKYKFKAKKKATAAGLLATHFLIVRYTFGIINCRL